MFDINKIKSQVMEVISYSQSIPEPKVDDLIDNWLENKRDIIEVFGGKLILESTEKVSFPLDSRMKTVKVDKFIQNLWARYHNTELNDFLYQNESGFFENTVVTDSYCQGVKIPKGMKLVKAMKYFESNKEILNQMQVEASQLIQEDKIEGKLCLSVHPLDYLSSSENTYNWRSCHALDGEYRAGNLSYMTDKSTIICYLKGEEDINLPNFGEVKWNSKKWRVLMFLSENWDMIAAGRQYPFASEEGANIVTKALIKHLNLEADRFGPLADISINSMLPGLNLDNRYLYIRNRIVPLVDVVMDSDEDNPLHYNDLLYSSCYNMKCTVKEPHWLESNRLPRMVIGNRVKCLRCGQDYITSAGDDTMMCYDCECQYGDSENDTFAYCDCCGSRFIRDEGMWVGDEIVCPNCFQNECTVCARCGEVFYNDDVYWDEENEEYYCNYCYQSIQEDREEYKSQNIYDED